MIGFEDVRKSYDERVVLTGVSFTVPDGGVLRITGPNGVGKSTLLKIALGLVTPDSGHLNGFLGRPVSAVFQEDRLCPWLSAIGNLRMVASGLGRREAEAALSGMGLPRTAMAQPVRQLSGGQRRRVTLARVLAVPAQIVSLDEPFTGIDAASLPDIIDAMVRGLAGKDVLLVTHEDAQAQPFHPAELILRPPDTPNGLANAIVL